MLGVEFVSFSLEVYTLSPPMNRVLVHLCLSFGVLSCATFSAARAAEPVVNREPEFQKSIQPLVKKYCGQCHGAEKAEAELNLAGFTSAQKLIEGRKTWLKVLAKVQSAEMPPKDDDGPKPTKEESTRLVEWLDEVLNKIDCTGVVNPGHVTLRRLNRTEYRNTVRDLVGVDYQPAVDFPADDVGYGFDNIGDVLSLPPILLEKYLAAAETISQQAISTARPVMAIDKRIYAADMSAGGGSQPVEKKGRVLTTTGEISTLFSFPADGEYELKAMAAGDQAGNEPVKMAFRIDGKELKVVDVKTSRPRSTMFQTKVQIKAGSRQVALAFLNDFYEPKNPDPKRRDRNLIVGYLELRGPLDAKPIELPESHRRILFVQPDEENSPREAAEKILKRLASRAFRRPATDAEAQRLVKLADFAHEQGESFEAGIQLALQAILISPHFLFKVEQQPAAADVNAVRELNDYELATRLSYFLWSSMPDDELLRVSWEGSLNKKDNLARQVRRMLQDQRSQALVDNFASQWFNLRLLDRFSPDKKQFPTFDDELRAAMRTETQMLFAHIMRQNRGILELLDADYTFVNERLARHYGIAAVRGKEFQRVSLQGTGRSGVLTHASVLTVTSNPTRTSPVKRGKWVLENLLGESPPPPPANVPDLMEGEKAELQGTLRQRMEQHRSNPNCATCHQQMDPLGFAFENFNAIGEWRKTDGKFPIDASGELPSGEKFQGAAELTALLAKQKRTQFVRCFAEKLLTYALGRGLEYYDKCAVDKITAALAKDDHKFEMLVLEIVRSEPFQKLGKK